MIDNSEIEKIIRKDLQKVLALRTIYQYANFEVSINEIILKQLIRFSNLKTFNDPFDCNENLLKIHCDKKTVNEFISSLSGNLSRAQRRKLRREVLDPKTQVDLLRSEREKFKISCFSELNNEVLMWSHYADKHQGICIGFDFPYKYEEKFILCPVRYLNEIVPLQGNANYIRSILYWLTTKSIRWEYEKEIRAINLCQSKRDHEYIHYDSALLKEIIFGINVPKEKIIDAIEKIKNSGIPFKKIVFKQMRVCEKDLFIRGRNNRPQLFSVITTKQHRAQFNMR